jgi:glycosyltransferase involved in cell wall biosynthesis
MIHQPPKVCFPFVGDTIGGSHISALLLASALEPDFSPVFCLHQKGVLWDYLIEQGRSPVHLPLKQYVGSGGSLGANISAAIGTVLPLRRFLRDYGVSIVHGNDTRTSQSWLLAARSSGIPIVWHQRTPPAESRITKYMLALSNQIICISQNTNEALPSYCKRRSVVITNPFIIPGQGRNRVQDKNILLNELGLPKTTRLAGFFGNMTDRKRPLDFVNVIGQLVNKHKQSNVVGVIFGDDRANFVADIKQQACRLEIEDNVRLMGFRSKIEEYMSAVDLMITTSKDEPFGRTVVEAMLLGTPVIASDSGGHREIIRSQETGILVPLGDISAFASTALELLGDKEKRQALVARAEIDARSKYSIERHKSQVCKVYRDLLD